MGWGRTPWGTCSWRWSAAPAGRTGPPRVRLLHRAQEPSARALHGNVSHARRNLESAQGFEFRRQSCRTCFRNIPERSDSTDSVSSLYCMGSVSEPRTWCLFATTQTDRNIGGRWTTRMVGGPRASSPERGLRRRGSQKAMGVGLGLPRRRSGRCSRCTYLDDDRT